MAVDTYALTTLAAARTQLNIPTSVVDANLDSYLESLINQCSGIIEDEIDRQILSRSYTEYQDGRANNRILLKQWPVTAVSEVWDDLSSEFTDSSNQFSSSEYTIFQEIEIALINQYFSRGTNNIKVVYIAGYSSVPRPLESCVLWMVEFFYRMRSRESIGVVSKGKNNESVQFMDDYPAWMQKILARYRRCEWPSANSPVLNG